MYIGMVNTIPINLRMKMVSQWRLFAEGILCWTGSVLPCIAVLHQEKMHSRTTNCEHRWKM